MTPNSSDLVYVIRHARTSFSADHIVNGRVPADIRLDDVGRRQCRELAEKAEWLNNIETCVTSEFTRTGETANLLLGRSADRIIEPRLNEIDYGCYEGMPWSRYGAWLLLNGPHAIPPGATESRDDALRRMFAALDDCLILSGPSLVVAHGLLVSVLIRLSGWSPIDGTALPEAPYVTPLSFSADQLRTLVQRGLHQLERSHRNRRRRASTDRYAVQVHLTPDLEP